MLTFLSSWSDVFLPLAFTFSTSLNRVLAVGMMALLHGLGGPAAAASISLVLTELLFLLLQRCFVEGIAGAVKN